MKSFTFLLFCYIPYFCMVNGHLGAPYRSLSHKNKSKPEKNPVKLLKSTTLKPIFILVTTKSPKQLQEDHDKLLEQQRSRLENHASHLKNHGIKLLKISEDGGHVIRKRSIPQANLCLGNRCDHECVELGYYCGKCDRECICWYEESYNKQCPSRDELFEGPVIPFDPPVVPLHWPELDEIDRETTVEVVKMTEETHEVPTEESTELSKEESVLMTVPSSGLTTARTVSTTEPKGETQTPEDSSVNSLTTKTSEESTLIPEESTTTTEQTITTVLTKEPEEKYKNQPDVSIEIPTKETEEGVEKQEAVVDELEEQDNVIPTFIPLVSKVTPTFLSTHFITSKSSTRSVQSSTNLPTTKRTVPTHLSSTLPRKTNKPTLLSSASTHITIKSTVATYSSSTALPVHFSLHPATKITVPSHFSTAPPLVHSNRPAKLFSTSRRSTKLLPSSAQPVHKSTIQPKPSQSPFSSLKPEKVTVTPQELISPSDRKQTSMKSSTVKQQIKKIAKTTIQQQQTQRVYASTVLRHSTSVVSTSSRPTQLTSSAVLSTTQTSSQTTNPVKTSVASSSAAPYIIHHLTTKQPKKRHLLVHGSTTVSLYISTVKSQRLTNPTKTLTPSFTSHSIPVKISTVKPLKSIQNSHKSTRQSEKRPVLVTSSRLTSNQPILPETVKITSSTSASLISSRRPIISSTRLNPISTTSRTSLRSSRSSMRSTLRSTITSRSPRMSKQSFRISSLTIKRNSFHKDPLTNLPIYPLPETQLKTIKEAINDVSSV